MFDQRADEQNLDLDTFYVSCAHHKSSYKIACDIVEQYVGENLHGHGQHKIFEMMLDVFEDLAEIVVVVLDEIDSIGDKHYIHYSIPRAWKQKRR